jgi:hypothetical protein
MNFFNYFFIASGLAIVADGIGSILVKDGQYHNAWFDGERYARVALGIAIVIAGVLV